MHASPLPNLIPVIPSAVLLQTPAADDMQDTLSMHITHMPGPNIPAMFPDVLATEKTYRDTPNEEMLLESMKMASQLGTDFTSPSVPALQFVNVGHGVSIPYTESMPEPYSECPPSPRSTTNSSIAVNIRHNISIPYTASTLSTTMHMGHSTSAIPPATPCAMSRLLPSCPVAVIGTLLLVQSPGMLLLQASTDLALMGQTSLPSSYTLSTLSLKSGSAMKR
ncbi:hypothetical protein B0H17DRAFT_1191747 [Mycena rosella]|uniref:Uncharacterized protein n=1 Tax=Mycena rosella TaxID=1033263 RepID=A0AAD7GZ71_MYCRO|nr:hypothetical protein B0H17DRAFT_1191747 [Mycena rosella]